LFLFTEYQWAPRWAEYCQLVDKPSDASTAIAVATAELHTALADLDSRGRAHRAEALRDAASAIVGLGG
jgi:hypothetical protein